MEKATSNCENDRNYHKKTNYVSHKYVLRTLECVGGAATAAANKQVERSRTRSSTHS